MTEPTYRSRKKGVRMNRAHVLALAAVIGIYAAVTAQVVTAPRIWDDTALADWATDP